MCSLAMEGVINMAGMLIAAFTAGLITGGIMGVLIAALMAASKD